MHFRRLLHALTLDHGAAALGLGIIAGSTMMVAAGLAAVVMQSGLSATGQLRTTVNGALELGGGLIQGPVTARTDGSVVTSLSFDAALLLTGTVSLDRARPTDRLVIRYTDESSTVGDVPYTVNWTLGNGDSLLEQGELAEISVDVTALMPPIRPGTHFALDLIVGGSSVVSVERTMPAGRPLDTLVRLP